MRTQAHDLRLGVVAVTADLIEHPGVGLGDAAQEAHAVQQVGEAVRADQDVDQLRPAVLVLGAQLVGERRPIARQAGLQQRQLHARLRQVRARERQLRERLAKL